MRHQFIRPVTESIQDGNLGIYSDYLMQELSEQPELAEEEHFEHLVVFRVRDFKEGVDHLRRRFEELGAPAETGIFDMTEGQSKPGY